MNRQESPFDRNLERLIHASCGPQTQLTSSAREDLHRRLSASLRKPCRPKEFPIGILALLTGVILLLAVTSVVTAMETNVRGPLSFGLNPVAFLVLVNLVCLPIACLVIIIGRKSCPIA